MATTTSAPILGPGELSEPPFARFLFANTRASIIWLIVRLYLGWQWVQAGSEKLTSPLWTGSQAGTALTGFAKGALSKTGGPNPNVQGWYATFLSDVVIPNARIFSYFVASGETLVGVALILGVLTGIAAFFGVVMNANYLLAGAVSTNPLLIILGALVMLAWRNAGWLGVDRWLLPALGTPWQPGAAWQRTRDSGREAEAETS